MNRKPVGKKAEPTVEELEFIYKLLPKLTDQEILEEMQGEAFPIRSLGFIKRRRREFNAARKVLQEVLKREIDPALVKAKTEHINQLLDLVKRWENQVNEITDERPLTFLRKSTLTTYISDKERDVTRKPKYTIDKKTGGYKGIFLWKGTERHITKSWLVIEEKMLFKYLRQHLEGEDIWNLYDKWKKSIEKGLEMAYDLEREINVSLALGGRRLRAIETARNRLVEELTKLRLKHWLPGKCDCCRD